MSPKESLLNGKGSTSKPRHNCFGPFSVRADLGASRVGPVYLGRDPSTNTRVVIRTIELSREWREFGELSDLLNSFRKLCETTLDHSSLARPLAFGAEANIPYVVYSDLAGTAMDAVIRQDGARPVAEVMQRTKQLAEAIDFAASAGIHHGTMAPCDVILDGERTGVTGFGLAQTLIEEGIPAEAESPYGSPQRLAGEAPTHADDIYSLAAITLELLIGKPSDPNQDTSPALREAQGPERRRVQRPAPHETRLFTTIAGVDAGKLRAAFAAAFSDVASERPSTASTFVATLEDAMSIRGATDTPAPCVALVHVVSHKREDPPSVTALELPFREEPVVTEKQETPSMNLPLVAEAREHKPQEREPETRLIRHEPIVGATLFADVAPPPSTSSIEDASHRTPVQSGARFLLTAATVAFSFGAGFGGGFLTGQHVRPSTESINVNAHESVAAPQLVREAVEDPQPVASTAQTVAPVSKATAAPVSQETAAAVSKETVAPIGRLPVGPNPPAPAKSERRDNTKLRAPAAPATASPGSLQVLSRPAGAQVFVDDTLIGTTPLLLSDVSTGSRNLRIELEGYKSWTTSVQIKPSARSRVAASLEP